MRPQATKCYHPFRILASARPFSSLGHRALSSATSITIHRSAPHGHSRQAAKTSSPLPPALTVTPALLPETGALQDPTAITALDLGMSIPCTWAGIGGRRRPSAVAVIVSSEKGAGVSALARPWVLMLIFELSLRGGYNRDFH